MKKKQLILFLVVILIFLGVLYFLPSETWMVGAFSGAFGFLLLNLITYNYKEITFNVRELSPRLVALLIYVEILLGLICLAVCLRNYLEGVMDSPYTGFLSALALLVASMIPTVLFLKKIKRLPNVEDKKQEQ